MPLFGGRRRSRAATRCALPTTQPQRELWPTTHGRAGRFATIQSHFIAASGRWTHAAKELAEWTTCPGPRGGLVSCDQRPGTDKGITLVRRRPTGTINLVTINERGTGFIGSPSAPPAWIAHGTCNQGEMPRSSQTCSRDAGHVNAAWHDCFAESMPPRYMRCSVAASKHSTNNSESSK